MHALADIQATRAWIKSFTSELKRPCVVLLSGELGAGKTQFVRWFLEELKAFGDIASPTFAIHHEYQSPGGAIDHVDLYRVQDDADLEASGFWDLFRASQGLVFVEWADRLPDSAWPENWNQIRIHLRKLAAEDSGREMEIQLLNAFR
ncbi:MAG TPA: tRNA (adenosine(37)-N6)-threonylcarbamoyltransferase complex ATPase subunit type 1 TsaE [Bdellovibrionales bacterium]|nr:tRNA (adenosine(37)-N6)-threonylcarbamoyltransferase complex ATPase subunit type 1 TsaE [Bdellovibrionales bacterium]